VAKYKVSACRPTSGENVRGAASRAAVWWKSGVSVFRHCGGKESALLSGPLWKSGVSVFRSTMGGGKCSAFWPTMRGGKCFAFWLIPGANVRPTSSESWLQCLVGKSSYGGIGVLPVIPLRMFIIRLRPPLPGLDCLVEECCYCWERVVSLAPTRDFPIRRSFRSI
jgi:hypothetical protein